MTAVQIVLVRGQYYKSSEGGMDGARTDIYKANSLSEVIELFYGWTQDWFWYDENSPLALLNYQLESVQIPQVSMNEDGENLSKREEEEDEFWFRTQVGDSPRHFLMLDNQDSQKVDIESITHGAIQRGAFTECTEVYDEIILHVQKIMEASEDEWLSIATNTKMHRNFSPEQQLCTRAYALSFIEPSEYDYPKRLAWLVLRNYFIFLKKDVSGLDLSIFSQQELMCLNWEGVGHDDHCTLPAVFSNFDDLILQTLANQLEDLKK
jgi:hypothetical protein